MQKIVTLFTIIFSLNILQAQETTIYLVRHGQTDWNVAGKMQGKADIALNATGRLQAHEAAANFKDICFSAAYSSGLSRAHETAEILTEGRNIPVLRDERFSEVSFGHWEGRSQSDFVKAKPEDKYDVESEEIVKKRVMEGLTQLALKYPGKNVLVVAHGGMMKYLLDQLEGISPEISRIKNLDYFVLIYCEGHWVIHHTDQMIHQVAEKS
jgi:broad specificity phosphatase PhoE